MVLLGRFRNLLVLVMKLAAAIWAFGPWIIYAIVNAVGTLMHDPLRWTATVWFFIGPFFMLLTIFIAYQTGRRDQREEQ